MQRYDLRHLHDDFYERMGELLETGLTVGEVGIFMFEIGDYSHIQRSADFIKETGHELMNSIKFNEVDWTLVVKKLSAEQQVERKKAAQKAAKEAEEKRLEEERIATEKAEAKAKATAEKKAKLAAQKAAEEAGKEES
ncbi:MAG: NADH-ubiquinone oxidoreductase chain E (EC [uncultured Sulfurovum sp.]|uniref:NADH-ubiquinone oxidoreductase chain E (EC) n=1 Tax=uncultured Sulfurovum sp. TaxID=269237 RepID=A0A6S6U3C3_9BACT|nr:MAG: NADH-ubiquinone oxidoreductase chain E (EC [uncultured Sulfurovum sp.]